MTGADRFDQFLRDTGSTPEQVEAARADDGPGEDREGRVWDLDVVADLVRRADVACVVEQTGGGCATIYAGEVLGPDRAHRDPEARALHDQFRHYPDRDNGAGQTLPAFDVRLCDGECERYEAAAGAGWFEGPWWTLPRASSLDCFIGEDVEGAEPETLADDATEADVAAALVRIVRRVRERDAR